MDNTTQSSASQPIASPDRIEALDTLRGFALLGILVMNVVGMALPMAAYFSPLPLEEAGLNYAAWVFAHLFFDLKMMAIFSILFGAGVVLMTDRIEASGRSPAGLHYRRTGWLLVIGLLHAYLIWHGDILVTYALCGLLLYLFRKRSPRGLLISAALFLLVGMLLSVGGGYAQGQLRDVATEIQAKVAAGAEMTERRQALVDQWEGVQKTFAPTPEQTEATIAAFGGAPRDALAANIHETIGMHTQAVPFMLFWRAMALMLLGMALYKLGVLTAHRKPAYYRRWVGFGLGIGLPLIAFGIWRWDLHGYDFIASFMGDSLFNYVGSIFVAMAYIGGVMRLCQSGMLAGLRRRLAAVGRMALTNYLLQSLLGVAVFYGYGLGLFGQLDRIALWLFIVGVWGLQLVISPWWLARYRYGPAEWAWRSLSYWRRQPFRRQTAPPP